MSKIKHRNTLTMSQLYHNGVVHYIRDLFSHDHVRVVGECKRDWQCAADKCSGLDVRRDADGKLYRLCAGCSRRRCLDELEMLMEMPIMYE